MKTVCVNCGTETDALYLCRQCGLYVQVEEIEESWKITLTVVKYLNGVERDEAQGELDQLVRDICDMDRSLVIDDEYLEEN